MTRVLSLMAGLSLLCGCGSNEVTVRIRGGDGQLLRLDANDLKYLHNRLTHSGTYTFSELKSGQYTVSVVAGSYVETVVIQLESPPMTGVEQHIVELQEQKRKLADAALGTSDESARVTREDLLALLE